MAYKKGSRFVDFEGGEPTLWRDGDHRLNDLYDLAKEIGFFSCTLTTNAQMPFGDTKAHSVWVSLDGYGEYHDRVRGEGAFERAQKNIRESNIKNICINMVINKLNVDSVRDTIEYAKNDPYISMISLNFLTPYPGLEDLKLSREERCRVIDLIIDMKRSGYPIMNSVSGLRLMKDNRFKKACFISSFILLDGRYLDTCPGGEMGLCGECGFCMAGEMSAVMSLKMDSILGGMKLRL